LREMGMARLGGVLQLFQLPAGREPAAMPSVKMTSSERTSKKGAPKSADSRKTGAQNIYTGKRIISVPKWTVSDYKPPRKISDKELEAARKMFFELDRDGSGSIDAEELGMMLRSLGQNPTEEELIELINSVDDGDKDGQIQLREFLKLYTEGLDSKAKGMAGKEDLANVFRSLGGDPAKEDSKVTKANVSAVVAEQYDLDIDVDSTFGTMPGDSITKAQLEAMLNAPEQS